jgi:hypothetical protein
MTDHAPSLQVPLSGRCNLRHARFLPGQAHGVVQFFRQKVQLCEGNGGRHNLLCKQRLQSTCDAPELRIPVRIVLVAVQFHQEKSGRMTVSVTRQQVGICACKATGLKGLDGVDGGSERWIQSAVTPQIRNARNGIPDDLGSFHRE